YLASTFGHELRIARMTAGLTQAAAASLAGLSQQETSKAEQGATDISLEARCRLAAATGHELGWRLYPVATVRLRDSGQMELAQAIVRAAHPSWKPRLGGSCCSGRRASSRSAPRRRDGDPPHRDRTSPRRLPGAAAVGPTEAR